MNPYLEVLICLTVFYRPELREKELSTLWKDELISLVPNTLLWIKKYLGTHAYKRLILTHHKNLNRGDYLVDDRTKNGADRFAGEHIHFGTEKFPDWPAVTEYLHAERASR